MKPEQQARMHAQLQHARAVADLYHDEPRPVPHDKLRRHKRYVMTTPDEAWVPVTIITIEGKPHYVPPCGFPFDVATAPNNQFWPVGAAVEGQQYQIELVWNREFQWLAYGPPINQLDDCLTIADDLLSMGDGERVKKCRIVNRDGQVVWENGMFLNKK